MTGKKSAFRFPNDPNAIFHQHPKQVFIDKRSSFVNPDYLKREKGIKDKNLKKREYLEKLEKARKGVNDSNNNEVMENEDKVIDLNDIYNNLDMMNLEEEVSVKKNKKKKSIQTNNKGVKKDQNKDIDMDLEIRGKNRKEKRSNNKKKKGNKKRKSKSHYIVNYV